MSACELPPMLKQAGCRLLAEGRTLIVLDRDGAELERGSKSSWSWLCAASAGMLIERWADALGLGHELHLKQLKMRLWRPGDDPEAAPWRPFEAALVWLAEVASARAAAAAQRLAGQARRWAARFVPLLGALLQAMRRLRARVWRRVTRFVGRMRALGQVVRRLSAAWTWAAGRGPPSRAGRERMAERRWIHAWTWRKPCGAL